MIEALNNKDKRIAIVGLGYVGLPLALEFGKHFSVIGFDINAERVEMMKKNIDPSAELTGEAFEGSDVEFTSEVGPLAGAHIFIVAVPTPVDEHKVPNLKPLLSATRTVAENLKEGDYVIFESTVYPGCTEEDCLPILESVSELKCGTQFKIGYSPERINPGDKIRTLTKILKIVSGSDEEALDTIAALYETIIEPGVHRATTIKVAEAAKIIENTQRDLNISLMNELSIIFDKMDIDTKSVLEAAGTKWNFLKFYPGLVGGHCIGVDPYYLLHKSREIGYDPQVILSGRRVNDSMPSFVAKKLTQLFIQKQKNPKDCKVLIMGITFKENVSDIRNSKISELVKELHEYSIQTEVFDPYASPEEVKKEYSIDLVESISSNYDAVIIAVNHDRFGAYTMEKFTQLMNQNPIIMDLKGMYERPAKDSEISYWRL